MYEDSPKVQVADGSWNNPYDYGDSYRVCIRYIHTGKIKSGTGIKEGNPVTAEGNERKSCRLKGSEESSGRTAGRFK